MEPVSLADARLETKLLITGAVAAVLAILGVYFGMDIAHFVQSLYYPESGRGYAFFSSLGYQIFGLPILALIYLRRNNCHQKGCPWIGRYPAVEGNGWHYCRRHHTDNGVHK